MVETVINNGIGVKSCCL